MTKQFMMNDIVENQLVQAYLRTADENYAVMGYKEHGLRHAKFTSNIAGNVLRFLDYPERDMELARIAGYMHDMGNAVGRNDHAQNGAILTLDVMERTGFPYEEIFPVISAIGGHEDKDVEPPSPIAAAVVLGDKTDVHHTRIRSTNLPALDMHARVNYACQNAFLRVDKNTMTVALELVIDTAKCPIMEYFEIFMSRVNYCRKASHALRCEFVLYINKDKFL
jgi:metal-dependent HD superfamily phosphatase/phosphodiesterase